MIDLTTYSSEDLHLELFIKEEYEGGCIDLSLWGCPAAEIRKELLRRGFFERSHRLRQY